MASVCVICRRPLADKQRAHAKTCLPRCRKALSRRGRVALAPAPEPDKLPDRQEPLELLVEQAHAGSTTATV